MVSEVIAACYRGKYLTNKIRRLILYHHTTKKSSASRKLEPPIESCNMTFRQHLCFLHVGYLSLAPVVGFEPTANRLTAGRSTAELHWNRKLRVSFNLKESFEQELFLDYPYNKTTS